ncbi:lipopolysaccharide biosynthesis protein [Halomonas sp. SL1]|uniref:lipopolysaccharide biosynthesis protein n=1 Tax=Halomonas sp. SL1 TaxID=2137478 RepID=UPI000D166BD8|nr:oligosaccharide flippase family protein [Halomonas sp. SL1]RAH38217.1 lipopolysaccharide biosynthesis protein [Halomonas sp. SL1]
MNLATLKARAARILPNNAFARSVSVLVGGTAGAQLLMVLASPLLTRLYTPDDFGLLAVYAGLLGVLAVIASLRYELAIPLPESDQDAASIVVLSLLAVLGVTLTTAILVLMGGDSIASVLGVPKLAGLLWLLPLGVLLQGCYKVFNYWAIRTKQFPLIAKTRLRQALATLAIQLVGAKAGSVSLLGGQATGQGVGSITLARSALKRPELRHWRCRDVWHSAKRYRDFPLFSTWGGFFNSVGQQLPPLLFASLFGAGAAGLYALAHRVLTMPMSIVGQAVGNVFFSSAAEAYREGRLGPLVSSVHEKLAQIAMPPALVLIVIGPDLFTLVFGEQWRSAGDFARWMAPWLYMVFITSPLSTLFSVMEKQTQGLLFQVILLLARVVAITLGAWQGNLIVAVMLFSGASALCWVGFLAWITRVTGNTQGMMLRPAASTFVVSLASVAPLWLGTHWPTFSFIWWLLAMATAGLMAIHYWRLFRKAF